MASPTPGSSENPSIVVCGDGALTDRLRERLAAAGFAASARPAEATQELARGTGQDWILIETAELARLLARAHGPALLDATVAEETAHAELPDEANFLKRADTILSYTHPHNDQLALLYVSCAIPGTPAGSHAAVEAETIRRLRFSVRDRDALAHSTRAESSPSIGQLGDEEYCILLPSLPRPHMAFKIAQRLQEKLEEPIPVGTSSVGPKVTIGIALHPTDARDATTLLDHARTAQRAVQRDAGTGVRFFQPSMNAAALQRLTLESALRKALQREELTVHYQPKVRIADGKVVGAEALVRWKHPELGMISPAQFIPIAEETGLILPIGEFVLSEACRQNARWQSEGLEPIRMAVNLSPMQLHEPQLLEALRLVLSRSGLAPEWLELEITESILLQDADATIDRLKSLRDFGIHLAIDDFGTGYSSLAYLRRFPIETLKIDQAFIRDLTTSPDDAAITTSIILMGKSLKMNVVAEGVETRSQLALLQVLECDEAQGYLFGKPTEAEGMRRVLERGVDPALIPPKP